MMGIVRFAIRNFRGVVELQAEPNGKSVTLRGRNGAGKSAAIDALWWGLGGSVDGEVVRNGAERAEVELVIDSYAVRRQQKKGGKATLAVKSADGKATYNSPTALLAGFVAAIERRTFSGRAPKEQAEILRRLAPGLDCADLDAERARIYAERTHIGREADDLGALARGIVVPTAPESADEEKSVAALLERQQAAADQLTENNRVRMARDDARRAVDRAKERVAAAARAVRDAEEALHRARQNEQQAQRDLVAKETSERDLGMLTEALVDPDFAAIKAELAGVEEHNKAVRACREQIEARRRAMAERDKLADRAEAKRLAYKAATAAIEKLDADKAARIAAAKLPIAGIALADGVVTLDDGTHGPVAIQALNSASRIRLDVAIAAALGHRLIAVRDASLLDTAARAEVDAFAAANGVQLLAEVVTDGGALEAVIEEARLPEDIEL